jgi:phage shock protein PspC (stress-responsive transcriptional regulator)
MVSHRSRRDAEPMTDQGEKNMDMGTQEVRRLIRRTDNKMIAGVAAGLGDYFHVDPVWFRLGFVVTAFMGGAGLLAYIVLWVIIPADGGVAPSSAERGLERVASTLRGTPAWIGAALVILGAILVLNQALDWRPGVIWGLVLIVLGVLFFVQRDEHVAVNVPGVPLAPPPVPGSTDTAALAPPRLPTGTVAPRPPRVRERSTLGFMTFGALLVTIGVVTLLDIQDVVALTPGQYLAMALGVIGVGLLVGSVFGRARWLIVPGMTLIPFVLAASLIHVPFTGGFGQRHYRLTGSPAIVTEYHLIAGDMTIDLRDADPGAGNFKIEATTVAGHILIIVPEGQSLDIEAKAGAGQISLFGQSNEGVNVSVHRTFNLSTVEGTGEPLPATIEIDVEAGLGQVEVRS